MSTPIEDALTDLVARLDYHTADVPGRILRAWDWSAEPVRETIGLDRLPGIRMALPTYEEEDTMRRRVSGLFRLDVVVSLPRADGVAAFSAGMLKFLDAVERDTAGLVAPLAGTRTPGRYTSRTFALENSFNAVITLLIEPSLAQRGHRTL